MKRKECEKQIIDLMLQIRDVYSKYNADGDYLTLAIMGDTLMANNMAYEDDADHPLDIYYVIKQIEKEHGILRTVKNAYAGRTDNMKSTADIFKNNELTTEATKKMLETCDESSEYIKGDMIYCRKCNKPRRKWM